MSLSFNIYCQFSPKYLSGKPNGFTAPADTGYGSPTQADTGYGSPTQAPNNNYAAPAPAGDSYGSPQADPQTNYGAPAPASSYEKPSDKPPIVSVMNTVAIIYSSRDSDDRISPSIV